MTNQKREDNVILFPGRKLKEVKPEDFTAVEDTQEANANGRQRKVVWGGSLLSVLFLATLMNSSFLSSSFIDASRQIQSTTMSSSMVERDAQFERELAKTLASSPQRGIASIGHRPSPEDHLRFGLLEGKYAVQFTSGKLAGIDFAASGAGVTSPKYVNDRVAFLNQYRDLLPRQFAQVRPLSREDLDGSVVETYDLVSGQQESVAEVRFTLDRHGRLLGMKVQSLAQNK